MTSFADHLDEHYGKRGTATRERYERGFEVFKLGAMLQELRKENGLTQRELARRCGTTPRYISQIENNASSARLSTLLRIIGDGMGHRLKLSVR